MVSQDYPSTHALVMLRPTKCAWSLQQGHLDTDNRCACPLMLQQSWRWHGLVLESPEFCLVVADSEIICMILFDAPRPVKSRLLIASAMDFAGGSTLGNFTTMLLS